MKRIITLFVALATTLSALAQMRTAYFMEGTYFRTELNPALTPGRGYVALPVLGSVGFGLKNNFISVDNLIYNRNGQPVTALDGSVSASEFLSKLPNTGKVSVNMTANILGVGFHTKRIFWNFGINARVNAEVTAGKELFRALKELGNHSYDLSSVAFDATAYGEVYLGAAIKVTDWLMVGVKLKGLVGLQNINGSVTQGDISVTRSQISGVLSGSMRGSGLMINPNYPLGRLSDIGSMIYEMPDFSNLHNGGGAVDLGLSASLLSDHLRVSAAVTDLGFISWSAKSAAAAEMGYSFTYRGMDLDSGEVDFEAEDRLDTVEAKGYMRRLNTNLNVGAEYAILDNHISFGLLWHTEFRAWHTASELTASVNLRAGKVLSASFSHTFCGGNRPGVFGAAINLHPNGINLFLGADFIDTSFVKYSEALVSKYLKSVNIYFGLGFNISKWRN